MELIQSMAQQLGFDSTFFYAFAAILFFYPVFSAFYIKPFQKLVLERQAKTTGSLRDASSLEARAKGLLADYNEKVKAINKSIGEGRKSLIEAAQKEGSVALAEASQKAHVLIAKAHDELMTEKTRSSNVLLAEVNNLADEIVKKVLGSDKKGPVVVDQVSAK